MNEWCFFGQYYRQLQNDIETEKKPKKNNGFILINFIFFSIFLAPVERLGLKKRPVINKRHVKNNVDFIK